MEDVTNWLEWIGVSLTLIIMLVSLFGLIIPIFPGTVVIWIVALIYGIVSGFGTVGVIIAILITVLMIASTLADNVLMGAKARQNGASWASILLALGGGIVFTFIFPPIGGLIAAPVLLYIAERARQGDGEKALQTVKALMIGWGWAFVVRFGLGAVMIVLWGIWAVTG